MPGFIKPVDGSMRARWVVEGEDADDLSLPANKVIFDSNSEGGLFLYKAGTWTGAIPSGTGDFIVTWPTLGYTPLVVVQQSGGEHYRYSNFITNQDVWAPRFISYPTGLLLRSYRWIGGAPTISAAYAVFRLRAQ